MIFVTGGTGLVGSHLLVELLKKGESIRALKRDNSNSDLTKRVFDYYFGEGQSPFHKIEWINGDIMKPETIEEGLSGVDQIYHCAGKVTLSNSENGVIKINHLGTRNMVTVARKKKVDKFCYVSSTATLGSDNDGEEIDENIGFNKQEKSSEYAYSKYLAEQEVVKASKDGLQTIIVHPSIIIGPGDWENGSSFFIKAAWEGFMRFYTSGTNGFVDVRDVAKTMTQLMNSDTINENFIINTENISFHQFFDYITVSLNKPRPRIMMHKPVSNLALFYERLRSILKNQPQRISKEAVDLAYKRFYFSNQKIRDLLDYRFIPIKQSIEDTTARFLIDVDQSS